MADDDKEREKPDSETGPGSIDELLAQREKLDSMLESKFTKDLAVMFTDLKGSTEITETHGDLSTRALIRKHNEIVFGSIEKHNGKLVKSIGDGTLSYFFNPQDAARAAHDIQIGADKYNMSTGAREKKLIVMRVGIHYGPTILEEDDIYGDTVNTASRVESSAGTGEIFLSEAAFEKLSHPEDYYIRFAEEKKVKGKAQPIKLYKLFWNRDEIEDDKQRAEAEAHAVSQAKSKPTAKYLALAIIIPLILVIIAIKVAQQLNETGGFEQKRSYKHSVEDQ